METNVYEFHSFNLETAQGSDPPAINVRYCKFDRKDTDRLRFCWGLCCLKGCIIGSVGLFYFIFIVPLGMILVLHGYNQRMPLTLWLGVGLLALTTIGLPGTYIFYRWRRHKRKVRQQEIRHHKAKLASENKVLSVSLQDEEQQTSSNYV